MVSQCSDISLDLSTVPDTNHLEAPTVEIEAASVCATLNNAPGNSNSDLLVEPEWMRMSAYSYATGDKVTISWIWLHGWRLEDKNGKECWLCKRCHTASEKRRASIAPIEAQAPLVSI
ncbi:hypothetical protein CLAFUW4_07043 [Fulvia fulva]|uniref:Uncharacterized protein n=1 Tax=Passalora fulva TaxID=5499 RepID=A0A9Q8PBS0_PASFU|nr:uncharacterized protein CLAFUR5_07180 [Fulvia fulva]KAK4621827.1 hypothetical protein CLAFUR4_07052 [Fulvia fulva]KAK4622727.1 hypothetical protein CLAFUR0_07050 [Fulvia fulva]UJO19543.1 hypothetical protein CLAFUR5_07180 [Fulvia fulva]WPV15793.1 hypothetical protein CLAFUW4_07043 [Fulvia fulva]WPV30828.1 hypothetical protein CLAFUW7_07043 [Fulvia fulva]